MTTVRLTLLQLRFELVIFALGLIGLLVAWLGLIALFGSLDLSACTDAAAAASATCFERIASSEGVVGLALPLQIMLSVVSLLAGILLGIAVVAREIESGTATLAWSLGISRQRWLLRRLGLLALIVAALVVPAALAANLWEQARHIPPLPGDSLLDHQVRGLVVVGRALCAFGLGALIGSLLGRSLPAVLITIVALVLVAGLTETMFGAWRTAEAEPVTTAGSMYIGEGLYRDTLGDETLITYGEAAARLSPEDSAFTTRFESVSFGIPAERAPVIMARETAVYVLFGAIFSILTLMIVERRRPY